MCDESEDRLSVARALNQELERPNESSWPRLIHPKMTITERLPTCIFDVEEFGTDACCLVEFVFC